MWAPTPDASARCVILSDTYLSHRNLASSAGDGSAGRHVTPSQSPDTVGPRDAGWGQSVNDISHSRCRMYSIPDLVRSYVQVSLRIKMLSTCSSVRNIKTKERKSEEEEEKTTNQWCRKVSSYLISYKQKYQRHTNPMRRNMCTFFCDFLNSVFYKHFN